jgi:uncharacterized Ntn-hydrolase superfamily protein
LIPDVPKAVERASAVFVGEVTDIVAPTTSDEKSPLPGRFFTIKFKVQKSWKGVTSDEINILSAQGEYGCFAFPPVTKGEKYLVYADEAYNDGTSQKDWLIITTCNRTALIPKPEARIVNRFRTPGFNRKDGSEDLKELEQMSKPTFNVERPLPLRPVHTFSIVARDPETGELGVAVQSHWFSVGSTVPWAEAGVGAVATQSFVDPSYGKLGLDLMRLGRSGPDALKALLAGDEGREVRQVAMIDSQGRVDAWTGKNDIQAAGHIVGKNYSVQANLMSNDKVWPAMSRAFETTKGDLAERMLAALDAAQAAGGDIRGRQSAALIVVTGKPTGKPWADRVFDLRVDDSTEPLKELRRLVTLQRAYNHMNAGDLAVEKKDNEGALREYGAAEKLVPDNAEMIYWHAVALVNMGRVEESLPLFRKVFAMDRNWAELTPRLAKVGLLPDDAKVIERILRENK